MIEMCNDDCVILDLQSLEWIIVHESISKQENLNCNRFIILKLLFIYSD